MDPNRRLHITQCISGRDSLPGLSTDTSPIIPTNNFNPRKAWQLVILTVKFIVRIRRMKATVSEPLSLNMASKSPYKVRMFRKVIDGAAFRVYGHWVKRAEGQNRALMFELRPKMEAKKREVNRIQEDNLVKLSCFR